MMVIRSIRLLRTSVKIKIALLLKYVCVLYGSKNLVCTFDMRYFYIHNLAHIKMYTSYIQLGIKKVSFDYKNKRNEKKQKCYALRILIYFFCRILVIM